MKNTKWIAGALMATGLAMMGIPQASAQQAQVYNHQTHRWQPASTAQARQQQAQLQAWEKRGPAPRFKRAEVAFRTNERPGTIIVDSQKKYLYLVEGNGKALRYGVGVGKEGFGWSGTMKVGRKAEWPSWTPPKQMIAREAARGHMIPPFMAGGPGNPLGARAMYLYHDGRDSMFRIHGTNQPWTIGHEMSSGCIRMMNQDVQDLYARVPSGTKVIVIAPNGAGPKNIYADGGPVRKNLFQAIFGS